MNSVTSSSCGPATIDTPIRRWARVVAAGAIGVMALWVAPAPAQPFQPAASSAASSGFQVQYVESFEQGRMPATLLLRNDATPQNVQVVDYGSPSLAAELRSTQAVAVCGRAGLGLSPSVAGRSLIAMVPGIPVDRSLIPQGGQVVFEADLFVPAETDAPSLAIVAVVPGERPGGKIPWQFYRMGFGGGKVYFSFMKDQPRPLVYLEDEAAFQSLAKPAWHRFAMVFEGNNRVTCAVDGVPTGFSPFTEGSLIIVQPGFMSTSAAAQSKTVYSDNLSVLVSATNQPLPAGPWVHGAAQSSPFHVAPPAGANDEEQSSGIQWITSPDAAWNRCVGERRPIAAFFFSPQARSFQQLEKILRFDPSARLVMEKFIPLKIDATSPTGQALTAKLSVFKVPCFVVFGSDGKEKARVVFQENNPWPQVYDVLMKTVSP